jgi:hypothetical protein
MDGDPGEGRCRPMFGVAMEFKQAFLAALQSGVDHGRLLELVRRYQAQGLSSQAAYEALEQIWRDFGFDDSEEDSALRDDLEYVMEQVWFGRPA